MRARFVLMAFCAALAGCGARNVVSNAPPQMAMPRSVSPGLISPAPMASTAILPSSAMQSPVHSDSAVLGLGWTQLPGSASQIAVNPATTDGSFWALSTLPSGPDKYIWHYSGGTWTNISGLASALATKSNGLLYAVNSAGGTYAWSGSFWSAMGGGASAVAAASDNTVYVISNGPAGDKPIWHNSGGAWSQVPGMGVALAASWDPATYAGTAGMIKPNGIYILTSSGSIWYENADQTFAQIAGSATGIAPTINGGVFVMGYPGGSNGSNIYYDDLSAPGWNQFPGLAVSIGADAQHVYAVSASGGIYVSSTVVTVSPSSLSFAAVGSAYAQPFSVSENGYSGSFSITSQCSGIASFAPASQPNSFIVTPQSPGSCTMTASDQRGATATLNVLVTTTTVTGQ